MFSTLLPTGPEFADFIRHVQRAARELETVIDLRAVERLSQS